MEPRHGQSRRHFDLGTGREIFAYAPKSVMPLSGGNGFPSLLNFPPKVQYFVDGSPVVADVFIDTNHNGTPDPGDRTWKTVALSGLRQGGRSYFALDVTQPDLYAADGTKLASDKDSFPDCIDGGGNCADSYPKALWEMSDSCTSCQAPMGQTWSRPVIGRIRVDNGGTPEDRYVAIFGGGFDPNFVPGTEVGANDQTVLGGAIYVVNMETGKILYKGTRGHGPDNRFAPIAGASRGRGRGRRRLPRHRVLRRLERPHVAARACRERPARAAAPASRA